MPMNRKLYPDDWEEIAFKVKDSAQWICAECGRPCRKPGESLGQMMKRVGWSSTMEEIWPIEDWVDSEEFGDIKIEHPQRFVLTVAHLNHRPEDCRPENLKALCAPCHLEYDNTPTARFQKRQIKAEREGQLPLFA